MRQFITLEFRHVAITQDERGFFIALGARIARLRKDSNTTQVQVAQTLDLLQSTLNAYELSHRRVPATTQPLLAPALGVSVEELIGEDSTFQVRKRGRPLKLMRHMERINALLEAQQKFVMQMTEMALAQAAAQAAAR